MLNDRCQGNKGASEREPLPANEKDSMGQGREGERERERGKERLREREGEREGEKERERERELVKRSGEERLGRAKV